MVQIAVVGAGYWGPNIIRNFQDNPHCEQVWVCDRDEDKLNFIRNNYGSRLQYTNNFDDVLKNNAIEGIAIVTDIESHYPLAEAALNAGKHVFVEKPLATTADECLKLDMLAQKQQRTLMVGHTFIYNPAVQQLKTIAHSGTLGELYYLHAQRLNLGRIQNTVNSLWSLAVHDVSIALHLLEERPCWVRAWGHGFINANVEDVTFVNMHFPSGKMAHIHVSWLDPEKKRQVTLVGSKQMVVYDDVSLDRKITIYDKGVDKVLKNVEHLEYKDFSEFQYLIRSGDVIIPKLNFVEPLRLETQHFLDCITGKVTQPITGGQQGYEVVKVLEAAQESLNHSGIPIEIQWE